MEEKSLNLNEIVKVTQLPEIYSKLEIVGKYIDDNLQGIEDLECTEKNKVDIKHRRTEINNTLKLLEAKRKEVKKAIEKPYNLFNEKYEKECKAKLENASAILSNKINEIEDKEKTEKREKLEKFFKQYQEYYLLQNIVKFDDLGLNITVSASEGKLKDEIVNTLKRIASEVNLINLDENKEELLLEYKNNGFDYANAKFTIENKIKAINLLREENKANSEVQAKNEVVVQNVETLISPPKEIEEEKTFDFTLHFKNVTEKKVTLMKAFFESEDIEYSD